MRKLLLIVLFLSSIAAHGQFSNPDFETTFELHSTSFGNGGKIPEMYSCKGKNISPELYFKNIPANAKSFLIICDDADVSDGFVHWFVYNIPSTLDTLAAGTDFSKLDYSGVRVLRNDFGNEKYDGPCPPSGETHHYRFKVKVLNSFVPDYYPEEIREKVLSYVSRHMIAEAELTGTFTIKK